MLTAIVTHETQGINPFDELTTEERAEYDAWSDEVNQGTRDLEPQDLAVRLYDDLDIWEIPGYGRVYFRERDDCWAHNGPRPTNIGLDNRYHATREGAMKALIEAVHLAQIEAVHLAQDTEHAQQWKREASLGHYGGWR